jgi:hypothetical protein
MCCDFRGPDIVDILLKLLLRGPICHVIMELLLGLSDGIWHVDGAIIT